MASFIICSMVADAGDGESAGFSPRVLSPCLLVASASAVTRHLPGFPTSELSSVCLALLHSLVRLTLNSQPSSPTSSRMRVHVVHMSAGRKRNF